MISLHSSPVRCNFLKGSHQPLILETRDAGDSEPSDAAVHASQGTFHETEMARLMNIDGSRPMKFTTAEILRVGYKGHTLSEPFAGSPPANRYADMIVPDTLLQGQSPAWEIWPHSPDKASEILYKFDQSTSPCVQSIVKEAMKHISVAAPCVNFTDTKQQGNPTNAQVLHIRGDDDVGCFASLGYSTVHKNVINLGRGCLNVGTAFHLLMHVLGVAHEHQRPDREEYLQVNEGSIDGGIQLKEKEMKMSFQTLQGTGTAWEETVLTVPYDVASITHGGACHYSFGRFRRESCPATLAPRRVLGKTAGEVMGNRAFLTAHDIALLRIMYGCGGGHYRTGEAHVAAASNTVYDISGKALSEPVSVLKKCLLDDQATFDWEPEREAKVKPTEPPTTPPTKAPTEAPTEAPVEAPTTSAAPETTKAPESEAQGGHPSEPQEGGSHAVKIAICGFACVALFALAAYATQELWSPEEREAKASVKRITRREAAAAEQQSESLLEDGEPSHEE
ncbi:hypothetical protein FOZ61_002549 [Perkinsus olseni]|uniref:Metalloendopeptidase n=1 Tax=Perkinsus olseni TaxID=32597 RepID=A0A7J6LSW9_PEROL|nr:hypothetical protein FOZ61_002549 [Perkinsus olseni]